MVEWFPHTWIFDIAAVIIVVAFPIFIALAILVFRARGNDLLGRRLGFFLVFHTLYQITWLDDLVQLPEWARQSMFEVNRAATSIDAFVYLAFVATALGWSIHRNRWFIPALALLAMPFFISVIVIADGWWDSPWGTAIQIFASATWSFGFLYSVVRWLRGKGAQRRQFALYSLALGSKEVPFVAQTITRIIWDSTGNRDWLIAQNFLAAVVGHFGLLVMAIVLAYAILRHHAFNLNMQIRWTVSKATLATFFIALFSIINLAASEFLLDRFGYLSGAVVAVLVSGGITTMRPLRVFADHVAARAVPDVSRPDQRGLDDRLGFYREQVEIAFGDGVLTTKEMVMLDSARQRLGLSAAHATKVQMVVANPSPKPLA